MSLKNVDNVDSLTYPVESNCSFRLIKRFRYEWLEEKKWPNFAKGFHFFTRAPSNA